MKKLILFLLLLYTLAVAAVYFSRNRGNLDPEVAREIWVSIKYVNRFVWVLLGGEKYPIQG